MPLIMPAFESTLRWQLGNASNYLTEINQKAPNGVGHKSIAKSTNGAVSLNLNLNRSHTAISISCSSSECQTNLELNSLGMLVFGVLI